MLKRVAAIVAVLSLMTYATALSKAELKKIDIKPSMVRIWHGVAQSPRRYKVKMYAYLPPKEKATGASCIILPGGSYIYMGIYREGHDIAKWLASEGIAGFVLSYRTAMQANHYPSMIEDLQRAVELVKTGDYNIDPDKVGVMGFSAGGHLAGFLGEYWDRDYMESLGHKATVDLKPAFVTMIYPVVTMEPPAVHSRSRRHFLGSKAKDGSFRDMASLEKNVRGDMSPVFIAQCRYDHTVDYRNAKMMDTALTLAGVEHWYRLYDEEGHGFGADPDKYPGNKAWQWSCEFIPWLKSIGVING